LGPIATRDQQTKEITLKKALTSIIAAAALVVPTAQATFDVSLPTKTSHAKVTKAMKVAKHKAAAQAKARSATVTEAGDRPSLITRQSFPSTVPSLDECAYSGNNCTLEQLCEFWNLSCDLVNSSSTSDSSLSPAQATYNDGAGT
jgi:hypothetical protein